MMISSHTGPAQPVPPADDRPGLVSRVTSLFGSARVASLPPVIPSGDSSSAFQHLQNELRDAPVVLFPDIPVSHLDRFFHLRLVQVIGKTAPQDGLSIIVLKKQQTGAGLAGGFAARFRSAWPFTRCVFVTHGFDPEPDLAAALGLPVTRLDGDGPAPDACRARADANQQVAVQIQPMWKRCGSTTAFQNQTEDLVAAGLLTIRVFTDPSARRGPTLDRRLATLIPENAAHAGAHINVAAVLPDDVPPGFPKDLRTGWATYLQHQSSCAIADPLVSAAAAEAGYVIANHMHTVGLALALAPRARLLLDVHDDQEAAARQSALANGATERQAEMTARYVASLQANILRVPDVCTYVNVAEAERLGRFSRRRAVVLPRVYPQPVASPETPAFDLFMLGDRHVFNILSLRWFLQNVWSPYLEPAGLRMAIAGRVTEAIDPADYASPGLLFAGFVEDLEALRARCRLTVVPDRAGAGIAVKTLTTLAAGHPLVTTTVGLRGLDPEVAGLLPSFDDPDAMAADILGLLRDTERLEARRSLVQRVQQAVRHGPDYATCLAECDRSTPDSVTERRTIWARLVQPARQPAAEPYQFQIDTPFSFSGTPQDHQVLISGWHTPEPWGRWTDGTEAFLRVCLASPAVDPLALEIDIMPSSVRPRLAIAVDGHRLPAIQSADGPHVIGLPEEATSGKTSFVLALHVSEAICPAALENTPDDRVLGIGVRSLRLMVRAPTRIELGHKVRVAEGLVPWDLLLDGWHAVEYWGCWSNGVTALIGLLLAEPHPGRLRLELDLVPPTPGVSLTVAINDQMLPAMIPVTGVNRWDVPAAITAGQKRLVLTLTVFRTVCPAALGLSADDRVLGIGLRGISLQALDPQICSVGEAVSLRGPSVSDRLLRSGWHSPEPWGCWTSEADALLCLGFAEPLQDPMRLTLSILPSAIGAALTVTVNGLSLPAVVPVLGFNEWLLPQTCTDGCTELSIGLHVSDMFSPAAMGTSEDDRILGIGVHSLALHPVESALCVIGTSRRISTATGGRVLLLEGWHEIEPWGCWSNTATARIGLSLAEPHSGRLGLELELVPPFAGTTLVVCVNDHALPEVIPATGINRWEVPDAVSAGQTQFVLSLTVSQTVCPAAVGTSADTRVLGIGLRAVTLQGLDPPTYHVGETVSLGDSSASDRVLRSGWHPAEPWGCWTSAADALLCVGFAEPLHGPMRLALSLLPSAIGPALTVTVNGVSLPAVVPTQGINEWLLPQRCTEDRSELSIGLHVSETFCPSANGLSADDRVLGIGVQSLMLSAVETSLCEVGETIRIASTSGGRGVLRTGWHRPEPWGCWSNQNEATLQLEFEAPLGGVFLLELDLLPPLFLQPVTVAVEDTPLLKRWVRDGINRWDIPRLCTEGQTTLTVRITVEHVARPADVQPSHDDRLLGVGIRSVRLAKSALAKSALA